MRAPAAVLLATVAALLLCSAQVSARVHLSEEDGESNSERQRHSDDEG